ncbi:MAG: amidohydrolase family protein, partial [Candidatus Bathyarchaeota archaeon]
PPWAVEKAEEAWKEVCKNIETSHKAGVPICAATDFCGSPLLKFGKNALELELLVKKCHLKPMEAIIAATKNAAEYACNLGDKIGTIETGKLADIIIVDGDPLEDISILQDSKRVRMVMRSGKLEVNRGI